MEDNRDKSNKSVEDMTQDEFDKEWERLFPIEAADTPNLLRAQSD